MVSHRLCDFFPRFRIFLQYVQNLKLEPLPFGKPVEFGLLLRLRFFAELPLRPKVLLPFIVFISFTPSHGFIVGTRDWCWGLVRGACRWKEGELRFRKLVTRDLGPCCWDVRWTKGGGPRLATPAS